MYIFSIMEGLSSKVKMYRLTTRRGLTYPKGYGAHLARGDVIMFYESHCVAGPEPGNR